VCNLTTSCKCTMWGTIRVTDHHPSASRQWSRRRASQSNSGRCRAPPGIGAPGRRRECTKPNAFQKYLGAGMATCAGQLNAKKKGTHPKRIKCIIHTERTGRADGTEDTRDMAEN